MYADSGLVLCYMQNCSQDVHQFEDMLKSYKVSDEMNNASNIPEYDLGEASDPILEEPILAVDPQGLCELPDIDLGSQQYLDKAFYESQFSDDLEIKNMTTMDIQKSESSGNLSSMDWTQPHQQETVLIQNFPDFASSDFGSVYGMRRAFSEGDIQKREEGLVQSPLDRIIVNCASQDRREKLSRYKNKKSRRNFGRKIKVKTNKIFEDLLNGCSMVVHDESRPKFRGQEQNFI